MSQRSAEAGNGLVFRVAKVDAGIAILISDSVHLIEFPSVLLPAGVGPGSIVNISCSRNSAAEKAAVSDFWQLQEAIFDQFGQEEPKTPKLRVLNTTQTSVTLEWDKLELAQAKLIELAIWRNGARLTTIPNPLNNTSTKLSGLSLDTAYTFHLVLKTTAGTFSSSVAQIRTHQISNTSGVSVCFGLVEPPSLLVEAKAALAIMSARYSDKIQIDTTHFIATSPASPLNPSGGPSVEYQRAQHLSIPVLSPEWLITCATEKKLVPIANYYSVGVVDNSLSISSSQLASGTRALLQQKPPVRRAAATTATSTAPTSAVVDTPATIAVEVQPEEEEGPPSMNEAIEEEPEAPPTVIVTPAIDSIIQEGSRIRARDSEETIKGQPSSALDDLVSGKEKKGSELEQEEGEEKFHEAETDTVTESQEEGKEDEDEDALVEIGL